MKSELDAGGVPVVAGFQGVDEGNVTTLGGGSDTTAGIGRGALGNRMPIYTDVDGAYTTDPRMQDGATAGSHYR